MIRTHALLAIASLVRPSLALAADMRADTSASTFTVQVAKAGPLSAFGHEHAFSPGRWRAEATFDAARPDRLRVELLVHADSLHDRERGLSARDRAKVDRQTAGPKVLDAGRFPEIRYLGSPRDLHALPDGSLQGILHGTLALHGTERPIDVPFLARPEAGGYLVSGAVSFRQSAFGIRPYTTALGAIGVRDEVRVEFELAFRPGAAGTADAPARSGPDAAAPRGANVGSVTP